MSNLSPLRRRKEKSDPTSCRAVERERATSLYRRRSLREATSRASAWCSSPSTRVEEGGGTRVGVGADTEEGDRDGGGDGDGDG